MMNTLALKDNNLVCRIDIVFFILCALCSDLFSAEITFTAVSKPGNSDLHSLVLDCNVSETPTNVMIYRKHPSQETLVKVFNSENEIKRRASFEIKNQPIKNLTGEYECAGTYHIRRPRVHKIINVSMIDLTPSFCKMTTNDKVINVTKDTALAEFCVTSNQRIERVLINGQVLFDKVVLPSANYKLENTTRESTVEFRLNLLQLNRKSTQHYKVQILYQTNMNLEFRFSLLFPKEHPKLCDETSNNANIATINNMAIADICVKPGDNVSKVTINDVEIFHHSQLPSPHYTLHSKTHDDKIIFTIGVLNLTTSSPVKYVVKIITESGLQLIYQFHVKLNPVTEISTACYTTGNATRLNVVKNNVTISMCVKTTDTLSSLAMNQRPISDSASDPSLRYAIKNETLGQHTQYTIEFSNLNKNIARNVTLGVTSLGQTIEYHFDLFFPEEPQSDLARSTGTLILPMLGFLMFTVIVTIIVL
ncbi:unnamed protein product [Lymnaea stagnalis]|uniref:Uncharacterized protein n=1 Tax=Lymnaea stagnalis TaxID=6523 RepID=A0AAV2IJA5_LYMST